MVKWREGIISPLFGPRGSCRTRTVGRTRPREARSCYTHICRGSVETVPIEPGEKLASSGGIVDGVVSGVLDIVAMRPSRGLCWTGNKPGDSAVPRGCPRDFRTSSLMIPTVMADWNGGCCCGSVREEDLEIPLSRRGPFCDWIQADARYGVGSWDQELSKVETRCLGPCSVEVKVQSGQQSSAWSKRASFPPVPTPNVFIKTNKCGVETGEFDARERGTL